METKNIVCFGDSNTHGYNSKTGGRFDISERWPCLLGRKLGEKYLVLEEGLSGRTTVFDDPLFEGLSGLSAIHSCLMSHEPVDLLIIMLGTNDTKERFCASPANISRGLERLILKAQATKDAWRDEVPNILVICPPPIDDRYVDTEVCWEMGRGCAEKSKSLSFPFKTVAENTGCHFLNAADISGMEMFPYDYMHLSLESHGLLAEELAKRIPAII